MASNPPSLESLGPNPQLRRKFLQDIVASLSISEVWELSRQLSEFDFRTDIIARLPVELRVLVASYLDATDIYTLLIVSKEWRELWLHEDALVPLATQFFPGFLPYARLKERLAPGTSGMGSLFVDAAYKLHFRQLGKFRSCLVHKFYGEPASFTLDLDFHRNLENDQDVKETLLITKLNDVESEIMSTRDEEAVGFWKASLKYEYSNGRVAWQIPENTDRIVVDDLRTQRRRLFVTPFENHDLDFGTHPHMVLGDKLLAVIIGRKIYAWDLETGELDQLTTHAISTAAKTSGNRICFFFLGSKDVLLWTFKSGTTMLDLAHIHDTIYLRLNLIFHPLLEEILYIVGQKSSGDATLISEFKAGILTGTQSIPYPACVGCGASHEVAKPWYSPEEIQQISPYGEYVLKRQTCPVKCLSAGAPHGLQVLTCFNVCDATITRRIFPDPAVRTSTIWHGQMASYVTGDDFVDHVLPELRRPDPKDLRMESFVVVSNELLDLNCKNPPVPVFYQTDEPNYVREGGALRRQLMGPGGKRKLPMRGYYPTARADEIFAAVSAHLGKTRNVQYALSEAQVCDEWRPEKYVSEDGIGPSNLSFDDDYLILGWGGGLRIWSFTSDMVNPPIHID